MECSGAKLFSLAPALRLYAQKLKNVKMRTLKKKQTYEKTNGGPMKRALLDLVGYEMTNSGPMKRT